jgi:hypothetical protein
MKKTRLIIALFIVTLQACENNSTIEMPVENKNFLLSSVYGGGISNIFKYEGNKVAKIIFVREEHSIEKEIIYNQDNQIKYSLNTYEFDDLSVSVDTTFVAYQEKRIHRTTTNRYDSNWKINEYFKYDEQNRLISVRQERIFNTTKNLIYNFSYNQENNVTRLDVLDQSYTLFEYDNKVNPYTQIDLETKIILGEWYLMNVLSKNNTISETRKGASIGTTNEYCQYVYEYNQEKLPVNRKDKRNITTFYNY